MEVGSGKQSPSTEAHVSTEIHQTSAEMNKTSDRIETSTPILGPPTTHKGEADDGKAGTTLGLSSPYVLASYGVRQIEGEGANRRILTLVPGFPVSIKICSEGPTESARLYVGHPNPPRPVMPTTPPRNTTFQDNIFEAVTPAIRAALHMRGAHVLRNLDPDLLIDRESLSLILRSVMEPKLEEGWKLCAWRCVDTVVVVPVDQKPKADLSSVWKAQVVEHYACSLDPKEHERLLYFDLAGVKIMERVGVDGMTRNPPVRRWSLDLDGSVETGTEETIRVVEALTGKSHPRQQLRTGAYLAALFNQAWYPNLRKRAAMNRRKGSSVQIKEGGKVVDQGCIVEVIVCKKGTMEATLQEMMPELWLGRFETVAVVEMEMWTKERVTEMPPSLEDNLLETGKDDSEPLGKVFSPPQQVDIRDRVQEWERENQTYLGKFENAIRQILLGMRTPGGPPRMDEYSPAGQGSWHIYEATLDDCGTTHQALSSRWSEIVNKE